MKILAISGSLRKKSYNTAIIQTLASFDSEIKIYADLGKLPFFNPDMDIPAVQNADLPFLVQEFRAQIAEADAIVISTPEYAFEIPGVLKNALDWLVSSGEIVDKPVAVISASTSAMGGDKANEVLVKLLKVLSGNLVEKAILKVSRANKKIDDDGKVIDKDLVADLQTFLAELKFG